MDMNSQTVDSRVIRRLGVIRDMVRARPLSVTDLRSEVTALLQFLASAAGSTDLNCRTVDLTILDDDVLWNRVEEIEAADPALADVLRDMAGALHDTLSAPDVAANFDSTPKQLLTRLGRS